jgi:actinin alpha
MAEPMSQSQKSLMDKTWERIQKKTFTGWCNNHLRKRALKIETLETDLQDGLKLIALLEIISGDTFPFRYEKKPTMRLKQIANVGLCLKFITEKGVKLVGIGPEEIVDGNLKLILGMIWTIILRFQIQDISMEELSAKEGLLLWCKKKTEGYKDVKVDNFHFSFQDGLALCALIHRHRPDLLDYSKLSKENKAENLQLAFDIAERDLDVPKLLDVTDMVDVPKPDERSVMTYVSLLYHVFSASQQAEVAGRRVGKVVDFLQSNEQMKSDYESRANDLAQWIEAKKVDLAEREFDGTLDGVQNKLSDFKDYKTNEKKPRAAEKVSLETLFNALQTKLNLNGRPPYQPAPGLSPQDIEANWALLEKAEHDRALALREELRRMKKIEDLLRQFNLRIDKLEQWAQQKEVSLASEDVGSNLTEVRAKLKNHEIFEGEFEGQDVRLKSLSEIADELTSLGYKDVGNVKERLDTLNGKWGNLHNLADNRKALLEKEYQRQQQIEDWLLDFAKRTLQLAIWLDNADEILTDPISCESVEAVEALQAKFDTLVAEIGSKGPEYQAIQELSSRLDEVGVDKSAFSDTTIESLVALWDSVDALTNTRRQNLADELAKQQANQALCQEFADLAKTFASDLQESSRFVSSVSGSSDEQLKQVNAEQAKVAGYAGTLQALQDLNQKIEDAQISENPYTEHSLDSLKNNYLSLNTLLKEKVTALEKEVLARSDTGLSPDQVKEFKECFSHFDQDKDNFLNRLELGACLKSLGQDVSFEEGGSLDVIISGIDKDNDGCVNFEEFLQYMESISTVSDTPAAVKDAFKVLANDKDYITEAELRSVLPPEKVDYLIANMAKLGDGYDYKSWTDSAYNS